MAFSEGEKITVDAQNENGWWLGTNQTSGAFGIFPANHIRMDAAPPPAVAYGVPGSGPGWDWGSIDKADAEFELEDQPDGTFLIRESASTAGSYTITLIQNG